MNPSAHAKIMSPAELQVRLAEAFPQSFAAGGGRLVEATGPMSARLRLTYDESQLRPGGTISGPTMFSLADSVLYCAILANIGWVPLAVTTGLTINFLRKPAQRDLIADCTLLKLGKRLAVGDVFIRSDGEADVVAHATGTYSIPKLPGA